MKSFLFLFSPFLACLAIACFIISIMQFGKSDFPLFLSISLFSSFLLIPSYYKYKSTEDDFLFLWVKTKSKRLRERKESAKEAMRKELEED